MRVNQWLIVNKNGIQGARKTKPALEWNEIAVKINLHIPDALFQRPSIEADIIVQDIENTNQITNVVVDTVDLIEQQTGAKINFTVMPVEEK